MLVLFFSKIVKNEIIFICSHKIKIGGDVKMQFLVLSKSNKLNHINKYHYMNARTYSDYIRKFLRVWDTSWIRDFRRNRDASLALRCVFRSYFIPLNVRWKLTFPNEKRIFRNKNVSFQVQRVGFHCSIIDFRSKMIVFTYEKTWFSNLFISKNVISCISFPYNDCKVLLFDFFNFELVPFSPLTLIIKKNF